MAARFEELAWEPTPMGVISLRRRYDPVLGAEVHEVKLDDEYLMSSAFTVAEIALAHRGLAAVATAGADPAGSGPAGSDRPGLDVVVGGLGLGETARAALEDPRVGSLVVVEALPAVIDWHRRGLLPGAAVLVDDPRTHLRCADFFVLAAADAGFAPHGPADPADPDAARGSGDGGSRDGAVDAVLLDVDHSPRHVLHPSHAAFYSVAGLTRLARALRPGGVFAMWSDDPPDAEFVAALEQVFAVVRADVVGFANPLTGGRSTATVYVATRARDDAGGPG